MIRLIWSCDMCFRRVLGRREEQNFGSFSKEQSKTYFSFRLTICRLLEKRIVILERAARRVMSPGGNCVLEKKI